MTGQKVPDLVSEGFLVQADWVSPSTELIGSSFPLRGMCVQKGRRLPEAEFQVRPSVAAGTSWCLASC